MSFTFRPLLPLLLTTSKSLWSINDSFPRTPLVYTIIIVALATYLIMFNINTLVVLAGRTYAAHKRTLVRAMKHDRGAHSTVWRERGRRFEVFRPHAQHHERLQPSEWLVPLYAALHPLVAVGWTGRAREDGEETARWWSWLRLRGRGTDREKGGARGPKAARTDEGWVL